MKALLSALSFALVVSFSAIALADAEAAAPAAPEPAGLISGNAPMFVGNVSSSPSLFFAMALNGGVIAGVGAGFSYDGRKATDDISTYGFIHLAYMVKNTPKFSMGPEVTVVMPFAPTVAEGMTVSPGWALWYAPFSAPVVVGVGLDLNIVYHKDAKAVSVEYGTTSLRLAYLF